ncbi:DUF4111 domain-containing protein [bacterium]|nr:DUF4111 domain-containing protein [bacterium]
MSTTEDISRIGRAFVRGLEQVLGPKLFGVYFYGAAAFPDAGPLGDIDFHVIVVSELSAHECSLLEDLHESLAREYFPLGGEMDGYYLLLADARLTEPPRSQMWQHAIDYSWALHRTHILAGRRIVLFGPDPAALYQPVSWPEIEQALYGELDYVARHLEEIPGYCVLNLCRLIYSFETREVVISKSQAAHWAIDSMPEWREHIELAQKSYAQQLGPAEKQFLLEHVQSFFQFADRRIRIALSKG